MIDDWEIAEGNGMVIDAYEPHAGQAAVVAGRKRITWLAAGRRWRKTTLAVQFAARRALAGQTVLWCAPTADQVRVAWRELKRAVRGDIKFLKSEMEAQFGREGEPSSVTGTNVQTVGVIRFRSLDEPDHMRGHTADGVVIDEAADVDPDAWYEVVRPILISTNGWALLIGTPKGRNWFWREWHRAAGNEGGDAAAWQAPLLGAVIEDGVLIQRPHPLENPHVPFTELTELFNTMPERVFRQEILAEFVDDGGGVFRGVRAASTLAPAARVPGHVYVVGVDWGRVNDFTVFSVLDATTRAQVALDRFNRIEYSAVKDRLVALCERWQPQLVQVERNSVGEALLAELQLVLASVEGFVTTKPSKRRIIEQLMLALERGRIALLDHPAQVAELEAYTTTLQPGGSYEYSAPPGLHDDTVIALALAWHAAVEYTPPMLNDGKPEIIYMRDLQGLRRQFPGATFHER